MNLTSAATMIRPRYLADSIVAQLFSVSAFSHSLGQQQTSSTLPIYVCCQRLSGNNRRKSGHRCRNVRSTPNSRRSAFDVRFFGGFVCFALNSRRKWARRCRSACDPGCVKTRTPRSFAQQLNPQGNVDESLLRRMPSSRLNISSRSPRISFHTAWTRSGLCRHSGGHA